MAKRKTLGSNQEKIVLYLAENPNKTMSDIQKEFNISKNSYNIIHRSSKVLEEMGYVSRGEGLSDKERPTYPLTLTEKGVLYALSKCLDSEKLIILRNYIPIHHNFEKYNELWNEIGDALFLKLSKYLFPSLQMFNGQNNKNEKVQLGLSLAWLFTEEFTEEERSRVIKAIFKIYPEFKKSYEKMTSEIIKFLNEFGGSF